MDGKIVKWNKTNSTIKILTPNGRVYYMILSSPRIKSSEMFDKIKEGNQISFSPEVTSIQNVRIENNLTVLGNIIVKTDYRHFLVKRFGNDIIFTTVKVKTTSLANAVSDKTLILIYSPSSQNFKLVEKITLATKMVIDVKKDSLFYDRRESLFVFKEGKILLISLKEYTDIHKYLNIQCNHMIPGKINGILENIKYSSKQVFVIYEDDEFILFFSDDFKISEPIRFDKTRVFLDDNNIIFESNSNVFLLQIHENAIGLHDVEKNIIRKMKTIDTKIGYTTSLQPFIFNQTNTEINLLQEKHSSLLTIKNEDIVNIEIQENMNHTSFTKISVEIIKKGSPSFNNILYVLDSQVPLIIFNTYYYTKSKIISNSTVKQLFSSWSSQANDYLVYNYFGQLFAIKKGIEQISNNKFEDSYKNIDLVNFIYHGIQVQRKKLDLISLYLPAYLLKEEQSLLKEFGVTSIDENIFKDLQQNLLKVSSEIKSYLDDIESTLKSVDFVIIPSRSFKNIEIEKINRGILSGTVLGLTGIGLATLTGGASLLLTFSGFMTALNSANGKRDMSKIEEIRKNNQEAIIEFHVSKVLDTFEHLMEVILPFYITQVIQHLYAAYNVLSEKHFSLIDNPIMKELLLTRLGQHYTFKQLPVDSSVLTKKIEVIDDIYKQVENSNTIINTFSQGVNFNVY